MAFGQMGWGQPMYPGYTQQAMPDQLAQLRAQQQFNPPMGMQMPQMPAQQAQPQMGNGMLWVRGEEAAKAYLVAPNTTLTLMDTERPLFYIVSADQTGKPLPIRRFRYEEMPSDVPIDQAMRAPDQQYVTRGELDEFREQIAAMIQQQRVRRAQREATDDEQPSV